MKEASIAFTFHPMNPTIERRSPPKTASARKGTMRARFVIAPEAEIHPFSLFERFAP